MDHENSTIKKVDAILEKVNDERRVFEGTKIVKERELQLEILTFLHEQLQRNSSKNKLTETLMKEIQSYFVDEEKRKEIGFVHLLKLMEIVNKTNNDLSLGIMNLISNKINKETQPPGNSGNDSNTGQKDKEDSLTKDQVQEAKGRFQLFQKFENILKESEKLKNSEFKEDEQV